jgi:hypothetical protein
MISRRYCFGSHVSSMHLAASVRCAIERRWQHGSAGRKEDQK